MNEFKPIKIRIKNFQSIEDLSFEIRGLTCIAGKSNIGKSAIIRSISSAILNNPVIGMVRSGSGYSTVEIECSDYKIKWEKGEKGINRYHINGKLYDKVGSKQLEEVSGLGFKSVEIGSGEVNPWLATQFFPIFLLDKPGSQVTEFISEVSRLNVLQNAITISSKGKRDNNDEMNTKLAEQKEIQKKLDKLKSIDDIQEIKDDLLDQFNSIDEYEQKIAILDNLSKKILFLSNEINKISRIDGLSIDDNVPQRLVNDFISMKSYLDKFNNFVSKIIPIRKIGQVNIPDDLDINTYSNMEKHESKINKLKTKIDKIHSISSVHIPDEIQEHSEFIKMSKTLTSIDREFEECKKLKSELLKIENEISDIEKEISLIPLCPTCSRPNSPDSHIQHSA